MEMPTFCLSSTSEVAQFESMLNKYVENQTQNPLNHISLVKVFEQLQSRKDGGRIFTALLDVQINFSLLYLDLIKVGRTWNSFFSKGKLEGGSILDSPVKFFGKMDIHRFSTSYILRYRALWDKVMGLLVMAIIPKKYDHFVTSKSRKKEFKKIFLESNILDEKTLKTIEDLLTQFDNTFRTAEAHGTGRLRKYSLTMESLDKNPQIELIKFWNSINGVIAGLPKMFEYPK
ncbi:hypothetical protein [Desulfosarcina variabilis]|uniref:hypothetical protein n=1 Tax=Desulfosarcina variabilis TaxID=2300 RepID=UPI003AFB0300